MKRVAKKKPKAATRHARAKSLGLALMGGYERQLDAQGRRCAICGTPPKVRRLNIDHDHASGTVRGLLCAKCNRGLGWFRDRSHLLYTASLYLKYGWRTAITIRDEYERLGRPITGGGA